MNNREGSLRPVVAIAVLTLLFTAVVLAVARTGDRRLRVASTFDARMPWIDRRTAVERELARRPHDDRVRLDLARAMAEEEVTLAWEAILRGGTGAEAGDALALARALARSPRFAAAQSMAHSVAAGKGDASIRARAWEVLAVMSNHLGDAVVGQAYLEAAVRVHPCASHRRFLDDWKQRTHLPPPRR